MFKKKECKKCNKKINEKYEFCPYCGSYLHKEYKKENNGMLGKDDFMPSMDKIEFPLGFNTLFNSLVRTLDKQFNQVDKKFKKDLTKPIKKGISINISSFGNEPPKIKITTYRDNKRLLQNKREQKKPFSKSFSEEKIKEFSKLPREEPKTNLRRLSNKVIYEIEMPKVKTINDISIIKLESSVEIRAIAKDKAYFKLIPINLPLINYHFSKERLILEFDSN